MNFCRRGPSALGGLRRAKAAWCRSSRNLRFAMHRRVSNLVAGHSMTAPPDGPDGAI